MSVVDGALIRAAIPELTADGDAERALRKALLTLIYLVQDAADAGLGDFLDFLLVGFPALSDAFENHRQPFLREQAILRVRDGERVKVVLREDFMVELIDALLGQAKASDAG